MENTETVWPQTVSCSSPGQRIQLLSHEFNVIDSFQSSERRNFHQLLLNEPYYLIEYKFRLF